MIVMMMVDDDDDDHSNDDLSIKCIQYTDEVVEPVHHITIVASTTTTSYKSITLSCFQSNLMYIYPQHHIIIHH